jgi:hypothetical protein
MVHRKFRWVADFKSGDEVLFNAFVKLSGRPEYVTEGEIDTSKVNYLRNYESQELTLTLHELDDKQYEKCWIRNLKKITEIDLGLYDGCGNLIEVWTLPGPKIQNTRTFSTVEETKYFQSSKKNERSARHDVDLLVEYVAVNYECKLPPVIKLDPTEGIPKA